MSDNKTIVIDGKIQEINLSGMLDITDPIQVKKYNEYMKHNHKKNFKIGFGIKSFLLGNIVDGITTYTGIKWFIKLILKDCGCEKRRKYLNKWNIYLPYVFLNLNKNLKYFKELKVAPQIQDYPAGHGDIENTPIPRSMVAKQRKTCNCKNKTQ